MCTQPDSQAALRTLDGDVLEWAGAPSELQNHGPAFHARTRLISNVMASLRPRCLLDIGCGRGYVTAIAARHAASVVATDVSSGAVEATRQELAQHRDAMACVANPLAGDWGDLAEGTPSPDVVLLSEVLEHIEDDAAALRSLRAIIRDDARLVLTVPANPQLWTQWDDLAGHFRRYRKAELEQKLRDAGFRVQAIKTWGYPFTGWIANKGSKMRASRLSDPRGRSEVPAIVNLLLPVADLSFRVMARVEARLFAGLDRGSGYVVVATPA